MLAFRRLLSVALFPLLAASAADPTPEQAEFFEKRIRPVLVRSCYACHSSAVSSPMGGLRVDTAEGLQRGGKAGPAIQPGKPDASLLISALRHTDRLKMPPSGKLADAEVADFVEWVRMGAPDPRASATARTAKGADHWAFRPVSDPAVPRVKTQSWVRSPIDAFVLAKLEAAGLEPAAPADRRSLLRRVTYDLTGLPPTPSEIDEFLKDDSPNAFVRVVDRLLASSHYGERWARHWLDLVRFAETNGHEFDNDKLDPWRYRDYVIRAFNNDLPYNQFVREHLAGDLLPAKRVTRDGAYQESPLGTAFFWFGEVLNSATDSVKSRADEVDNQIDIIGKAFQGLTVACARCHDHKFDPIPTADYYALAGVLHSTALREGAIDSTERDAKLRALSRDIRIVNAEMAKLRGAATAKASAVRYRAEDSLLEGFDKGFGKWQTSGVAFGDGPEAGQASSLAGGSEKFVGTLTSPKFRTTDKLFLHVRFSGTKSEAGLKERGPLRLTTVCDGYKGQHVVPTGSEKPEWKTLRMVLERNRTCYIEIVDHSREGHIAIDEIVFSELKDPPPVDDVPAETEAAKTSAELDALKLRKNQLEEQIPDSAFAMMASDYEPHNVQIHVRGSHTNLGKEVPRGFLRLVSTAEPSVPAQDSGRMQVAEWIASPRNPLTARVMVNRIWKHHFVRGLARTPDNFGAMGEAPTHPELLDYLASRFVENGWSVKAMHRLILLSNAYQMSAEPKGQAAQKDPENKLLHSMPVRRLEAEAIRDSMLAVAGTLEDKMYGPSVPPHISKYQDGRGKPVSGPLDGSGRRSIYIQLRRNFLPPLFLAFDYPLPISTIGARGVSTVPSQALMLLNNEFIAGEAKSWAGQAIAAQPEPRARVSAMYQRAFGRPATESETNEILGFVKEQGQLPEAQVWSEVAHVLFNSPEFIYVR